MNKVEKVSIGGVAFTLDQDAFIAVNKYLSELQDFYSTKESGAEIMEEIEGRFSELLFERCGVGKVASVTDIEEVIMTLGRPSEIESEERESSSARPAAANESKPKKRLFRDIDGKSVAGVCSGLANYLGIDVTLIRIIFTACAIVGFFSDNGILLGATLIAYCVLWIAMPAAKTVKQKWEQKGQGGTVQEVSRFVERGGNTPSGSSKGLGHGLGRFILVLVGVLFLLTGVSGLTAGALVTGDRVSSVFNLGVINELMSYFTDLNPDFTKIMTDLIAIPWVKALLGAAVILPFILLLYFGLKMIIGFKSPSWRPGAVLSILWLIIVVVLLVTLVVFASSAAAEVGIEKVMALSV